MLHTPTLRIVESPPEASLHPLAIWQHWRRHVIWDPRTYYGLIELIGLLVVLSSAHYLKWQRGRSAVQYLLTGLFILLNVAPLHWYSTHRSSSHVLTRTRTHMNILLGLALTLLIFEIRVLRQIVASGDSHPPDRSVDMFFGGLLSVAFALCLFSAYIIFSNARTRLDPLIAELPYALQDENGERRQVGDWANADVAEGIPDDSPEPEGQVRL